jgi:histone-lysine N-methyltransferase SETMAR
MLVTMQQTDSRIQSDWRITTRKLATIFGVGKGSVNRNIHHLGYSKMCARWVPRSLTEEHKEQRKIICLELLACYEAEDDDFLSTIVMGNETWIDHFEPETKFQSMEWYHTTSPWKKKFKAIPSASKIMATVF